MYLKNESNKGQKLGVVITAVILFFLIVFSNFNNAVIHKITSPFNQIVTFVQGGFQYVKNKFENNETYFSEQEQLKNQVELLQSENNELKEKVQEIEVVKSENRSLKEQMKLSKEFGEFNTLPGYVIQEDYSNYSKNLVINLGYDDGVKEGMTVIATGGLVGHISSVDKKSSTVQTIIDTASAVSIVIDGTEKSMIARGTLESNNTIKGSYIDNDLTLNEQDKLVTSGIGGIYPKGIFVGEVQTIVNNQNKTNRYVEIKTNVDFNNLSNILVIKND